MGHNKRPIDSPWSYAYFIFDKGIKNIHWGEKRQSFNNVVKTGYPPEEEGKENHMFHHAHKWSFQIGSMNHDSGVHVHNGISFNPEEKLHLQEKWLEMESIFFVFFSIFILFLNNLKPRTPKPLKQSTEETFRNTCISNKFLNGMLKAQETAPRTDKSE